MTPAVALVKKLTVGRERLDAGELDEGTLSALVDQRGT